MPATPQRRWLLLRCRAASSTPLPPASTGHPSPTTAEFQSAPHLPQKPTPCPHAAGKRNWRRHATHLIEAPERASPSRLLARCAGDDGGAGAEAEAARAGGRGRGRGGGGEGKERRRGEERGDARHLLLLATRGV